MKVAFVAVLAVLAIISMTIQPGNALTCGQIDAALAPCITYLSGHGGDTPPPACCAGVKTVKELAQTTADKRFCCSCVKAAAVRDGDLSDVAAHNLAPRCGVVLDIPVSRTVDCDKIN